MCHIQFIMRPSEFLNSLAAFFLAVFIRIVNSIYVLLFYLLFCMKLDFALTNVSKISKTILIVACFIIIMETHFAALRYMSKSVPTKLDRYS